MVSAPEEKVWVIVLRISRGGPHFNELSLTY